MLLRELTKQSTELGHQLQLNSGGVSDAPTSASIGSHANSSGPPKSEVVTAVASDSPGISGDLLAKS